MLRVSYACPPLVLLLHVVPSSSGSDGPSSFLGTIVLASWQKAIRLTRHSRRSEQQGSGKQ
eukprot:7584325-Alexandrium_andersonii.AAC.1